LPSVAASGMVVIGRQNTYEYFASQQPIAASRQTSLHTPFPPCDGRQGH
jgi:hypothetical protein